MLPATTTSVPKGMMVALMVSLLVCVVDKPTAHAQYVVPPTSTQPPPPPPPAMYVDDSNPVGSPPLSKDETIALAVGLAIGIPVFAFGTIGLICCLCDAKCKTSSADGDDTDAEGGAPPTSSSSHHRHHRHYRHTNQFEVYEGICISMVFIEQHQQHQMPSSSSFSSSFHNTTTPDVDIIIDNSGEEEAAMGSILHHHREHGSSIHTTTTNITSVTNNINVGDHHHADGDLASSHRHNEGGMEVNHPAADFPEEILIHVVNEPSSPLIVEDGACSSSSFSSDKGSNPYGTGTYMSTTSTSM